MRRYVARLCADPQAVDDLAQETFLRAPGVLFGEVGAADGGRVAVDAGVGSVAVVPVQPVGERFPAFVV